jgi:ATP-binding cassette, subfamily B, bacterial PglK
MISTLKKINFLITKRQRKGLVILTLLLFIGMILEVFGLGILIPALSILLDPKMIETNSVVSFVRHFFTEYSNQNFLFIVLGTIVTLYFLKSLFLVFLTHKQNRFITNIIAYISNKLFKSYMSKPYSFHLNRNSSELIKNIQIEIYYVHMFLLSLINLFTEAGFVIAILSTLIYIEPTGAISIGIFYGFLSIIFFQFTRKKIKLWGILRQDLDAKVSKIALEGLGGIKDLLILGKTSFFTKEFSKKNHLKARITANQATISQIPRFYLELISIIGLVSFIILLLLQGKDSTSLFTVLGVFVAATFRMIPSLNRIISASQTMKYYSSSIKIIHKEVEELEEIDIIHNKTKEYSFKNCIELKMINFSFKKNTDILKNINFKIRKGQTIGIIGESGSGKSTLIDLIIGLQKPNSGEILIDGINSFQINQSWRNNIGYVSQVIYLTDDTIKKNIALGVPENEINDTRIIELLKQVQLEKVIKNLEFGINSFVGERGVQLSGGQRQRIGLARALYHNPEILILDEATSSLDDKTENEVMKSIELLSDNKTVIIIAHRLSTLGFCKKIFELKNSEFKEITL